MRKYTIQTEGNEKYTTKTIIGVSGNANSQGRLVRSTPYVILYLRENNGKKIHCR